MVKLTLKLLEQRIEDLKLIIAKQGVDLLKASLNQPDIIKRHRRNIKYKKR